MSNLSSTQRLVRLELFTSPVVVQWTLVSQGRKLLTLVSLGWACIIFLS